MAGITKWRMIYIHLIFEIGTNWYDTITNSDSTWLFIMIIGENNPRDTDTNVECNKLCLGISNFALITYTSDTNILFLKKCIILH